jgi:phosphoribosylamine--glycine ligase
VEASAEPVGRENLVSHAKAAADLAVKLSVDLTIVGPEMPLVLGIADEFERRGLVLLGPTRNAAQLEGSKVFAKIFMERHGIPTAAVYGIYDSPVDAYTALCSVDWPLVIKADGLCAGKGVLVTSSPDEATAFIDRVMEKKEFGDAGKHVLLEEGLIGEELSYIVLTDGDNFIPMVPTRDHKRVFDNDEGPNTGGMGAYSTDEILPSDLEKKIIKTIVRPTLAGLKADAVPYRGFLYFGLMLTQNGPKLLEYNCRLGDPETEAIMLRVDFDLAQACEEAARGHLGSFKAKWHPGASACVIMASENYPGSPVTGKVIQGLRRAEEAAGVVVFHAGTRRNGDAYYTSGGRILGVCSRGDDLVTACMNCYEALNRIHIEGAHYRRDIGSKKPAKTQPAGETPNV